MQVFFGQAAGGHVEFGDVAALKTYVNDQFAAWNDDAEYMALLPARQGLLSFGNKHIAVVANWRDLANQIGTWEGNGGTNVQWMAEQIADFISSKPLMSRSSDEAAVFMEIASETTLIEASASALYLAADRRALLTEKLTAAEFTGFMRAYTRVHGLDKKSADKARTILRNTVDRIRWDAQALSDAYDVHKTKWDETSTAATALMIEHTRLSNTLIADAEHSIAEDRKRWEAEWARERDHYVEQLKLRAAVKQWGDRAESHEAAFIGQRGWTVGLGIGGLVVAGVWAWGALDLARWLFSDAFVEGTLKAEEGALRPTWSHELIFAAASTVLYLTLFLWMMRIMVRMMMSEHHLGVDARARESMAHTYLALIENDGAASVEDRAIVLASLFRPITDGLVKDDALPLISPAALLSGGLAGKG